MNYDVILGWLFGFTIFTTIMITLHEFIQYKFNRIKTKSSPLKHPTQGKYFTRFLPLILAKEYKARFKAYEESLMPYSGWPKHIITFVFVGTYAFAGYHFYEKQSYLLFKPIDLTIDEKRELKLDQGIWVTDTSTNRTIASNEKQNFILIKSTDETFSNNFRAKNLAYENLKMWQAWLDAKNIKHKTCHWERINNCQIDKKRDVLILLSSYWDKNKISYWLDQGLSIILYGVPAGLTHKLNSYTFLDITFKKTQGYKYTSHSLRLLGEKKLTLGFDAGTFIYANAFKSFSDYSVHFKSPDAITSLQKNVVGGPSGSRLISLVQDKGRLIWTDINFTANSLDYERELDQLFSNFNIFLKHQKQSTIATWPEGKQFAAFVEQDSEDKYEHSKAVVQLFKKMNFPISWFVVSDLAEKNKRITRKMASLGEIACHGDSHDIFPDGSLYNQTYRLAKCKKTLKFMTDKKVIGFRPPEEKYNTDTLDALANLEFEYLLADQNSKSALPSLMINKSNNKRLVFLGRINRDDYYIWGVKNYTNTQAKSVIEEDIQWLHRIGGLYFFSFHTQYIDSPERLAVIEFLLHQLKNKDPYIAQVKDMADWWRFRHELIQGRKPSSAEIDKFKPMVIQLNEDGSLEKNYISGND